MKKKDFLFSLPVILLAAVMSLGLVSCGDDDPDEVSVSMPAISLSESGGSQTIQVMSNTKWTVTGNPGWLTVQPSQGSNNGTFSVSATGNTETGSRTCTLLINAGSASATISVYQSGLTKLPAAEEVSGSYTGTLKPMGYSDEPARCYVTLSKLSKDAVRVDKIICEKFGIDMNPVNLSVKEDSDGRIILTSETSYSIEGSYYLGQLSLSFSNSLATFYFSGSKN